MIFILLHNSDAVVFDFCLQDEGETPSSGAPVPETPQKPTFQISASIFGGTGLTTPTVTSKADTTLFETPRAETTGLFGDTTVFGTPKASFFGGQKDGGLSLNQPIFGGAASKGFSTGGATFSFGQTVTSQGESRSWDNTHERSGREWRFDSYLELFM